MGEEEQHDLISDLKDRFRNSVTVKFKQTKTERERLIIWLFQ